MDLKQVQATWEAIGRDDPFWAVLSRSGTEHGQWDVTQFFVEGERDVSRFLAEAEMVGASPVLGDALDFGCGVGRLTRALSTRFSTVTGLDVSAPMVEQANRLVAATATNTKFVVSTVERLPFPDDSFDFILTNIVLQHLPGRLALNYVREFMRVLRPNGVAVLQMPSESLTRSRSSRPLVARVMNALPSEWREELFRRRTEENLRDLPMHGIPRTKLLRFIEHNEGRVHACIEDHAGGPQWRSFHYIVRKSSGDGSVPLAEPARADD